MSMNSEAHYNGTHRDRLHKPLVYGDWEAAISVSMSCGRFADR